MPHAYLQGPQLAVLQTCRKVPFGTRRLALRQLQGTGRNGTLGVVAQGSGPLGVYRCPWCESWHIGHNSKEFRNAR